MVHARPGRETRTFSRDTAFGTCEVSLRSREAAFIQLKREPSLLTGKKCTRDGYILGPESEAGSATDT